MKPSRRPMSAPSLLGESGGAASPLTTTPALLAFTPVSLVGLFAPLMPVTRLPLRGPVMTPSPPGGRGHRVVPDRDLEDRARNVRWFSGRPRAVPGRPDVPSTAGKDPVL